MPKKFSPSVQTKNSPKPQKLSRTKIENFVRCPLCFYLDVRLGVRQPAGYPFNLNSAVDHLLKKEFDVHRAQGEKHPLMEAYGIDAVPYEHAELDRWRQNFVGVQYLYEPENFLLTGAVDDVWVSPKGELHVVDYKATSKDSEVDINADWQQGYKRQIEIYQWLLRRNGFTVSDVGYFVYANGRRDAEAFDGKLEFNVKIIPYKGDDGWIEGTIKKIASCLRSDVFPAQNADCEYCKYRVQAHKALHK